MLDNSRPQPLLVTAERDAHLFSVGPKRILALDGGGTLGIIELAFLERIESLVQQHFRDSTRRVCQVFDLIGGTSTGAIIAACLALGKPVVEVTKLYLDLAPRVFRRHRWRIPALAPIFDAAALTQFLGEAFGECRLDSELLRTGFAVVTRRYDTGSPWVVANNPRGPFWEDPPDQSFMGNRHFRLADIVRASSAAPGLFSPQLLKTEQGQQMGVFVDGALSPYNNPSLALLMLSQLQAYGIGWQLGAKMLTIISLGTGLFRHRHTYDPRKHYLAGELALRALLDTIADGQMLSLTLLQWLGESPAPWIVNSEIGDLRQDNVSGEALFRFQRYDLPLESSWLREKLGSSFRASDLVRLRQIDNPDAMLDLYRLASEAAAEQVQADHFLTF